MFHIRRAITYCRESPRAPVVASETPTKDESKPEVVAVRTAVGIDSRQKIPYVNTPDVHEALDLLERYVRPEWVVPQLRHALEDTHAHPNEREGQNQMLRATFPGIRDGVKEMIGRRMDALARKFHETKDVKVSEEIRRLAEERTKLNKPWAG